MPIRATVELREPNRTRPREHGQLALVKWRRSALRARRMAASGGERSPVAVGSRPSR